MESGYFKSGLPYARIGWEPDSLIIFDGLGLENKPQSGISLRMLKFAFKSYLEKYSVFLVTRKPCLPEGYTTRDMSNDYARMIQEEFNAPVDIMGLSTGGEIAQYFAADYPHLVRRLVLGSTAYKVGDEGKRLLRSWKKWTLQDKWKDIHVSSAVMYHGKFGKAMYRLLMRFFGQKLVGAPSDPSDYIVTIEGDLTHDASESLRKIQAPTLVIGGTNDVFYPEPLIRKTVEKISNARLILYRNVGHKYPAKIKKRFDNDVLSFLGG